MAARLPAGQLYVDGEWRDAADGATFSLENPATGRLLTAIAAAARRDVDAAVTAARREFDGGPWSRLSGADRGRLLLRLAELMERDCDELAELEALDVGKPVGDPRGIDVPAAIETFRHFAGWADKVRGETVPVPDFGGRRRLSYTVREPVGVVGAITPWNAPTMIAAWKIAPALAVGCTVVVKPPEDAPLTTLKLAALAQEAELPAGVLNVLPGFGAQAGAELVRHPGVDKISFTGSPEAGAEIARVAGPAFKRLTLELGGKSPQVIRADADLDAAMPVVAAALFANAGEICAAGSRVLVHRDVRDEVVERLAALARELRVGDPFDPATRMGALINARQLARVLGYVESGTREGARLVTGGRRVDRPGHFVEPTLFVGSNDHTIAREEIFGPVGTVIEFADDAEALRLANDTRYGLAAMLWTRDLSAAHTLAAGFRAGAVWVNGWGIPDPRLPWGGVRASGVGRELGLAGIHANTEEKVVSLVL